MLQHSLSCATPNLLWVFKILGKLPHSFDSTAVMPKETKQQGLLDTKSAWLALGIR